MSGYWGLTAVSEYDDNLSCKVWSSELIASSQNTRIGPRDSWEEGSEAVLRKSRTDHVIGGPHAVG